MTPQDVQDANLRWWHENAKDYPFQATTPFDATGKDFLLGDPARRQYGEYAYCPMPVALNTLWGFKSEMAHSQFIEDVGKGKLNIKSVIGMANPPAPSDSEDFDIL